MTPSAINAADGSARFDRTVPPETASQRLDLWLAAALPGFSRARIQALMREGRVTREGHPVRPSDTAKAGQTFVVQVPPPAPAIPQAEARALDIVYEDADIVVIDKPAGLVVHPAPGHATGTLVNALLHHCDDLAGIGGVERPGIVHRLDKDTTGLLVVAKHDAAMAGLVRAFQTGGVRKEYLAIVHGAPPHASGTLTTLIGRDPTNRKRMAVVRERGKRATTHYRVAERFAQAALVEARIETGRTHQIRVHLARLGAPIAGDALYGGARRDRNLPLRPDRPMLHATRLAFAHPITGQPLAFERPPHADMLALLAALRETTKEK
jgi:23S rRNA pseudouridine1911/1915/1917 synthase